MTLPYLTDNEIDEICAPLVMPAAQCRYLERELKLLVMRKPNGRALVARSEFERVLGAARLGNTTPPGPDQNAVNPNIVGLQQWAQKRKHGAQAKGR